MAGIERRWCRARFMLAWFISFFPAGNAGISVNKKRSVNVFRKLKITDYQFLHCICSLSDIQYLIILFRERVHPPSPSPVGDNKRRTWWQAQWKSPCLIADWMLLHWTKTNCSVYSWWQLRQSRIEIQLSGKFTIPNNTIIVLSIKKQVTALMVHQ